MPHQIYSASGLKGDAHTAPGQTPFIVQEENVSTFGVRFIASSKRGQVNSS